MKKIDAANNDTNSEKFEIEDITDADIGDPIEEVSEEDLEELTTKTTTPIIRDLKVSADGLDTSEDERKRRVKKLAGAISHALRKNGEINVRCFGDACIAKGAKALAIAQKNIESSGLFLSCSPGFIETELPDGSIINGISFFTFTIPSLNVNPDDCPSVLKVSADPKEIDSEGRLHNRRKLAGAITHALKEHHQTVVRAIAKSAIGKAVKALAMARGYTAQRGPDLYCWPTFIVVKMGDGEKTGIAFFAYTNEL